MDQNEFILRGFRASGYEPYSSSIVNGEDISGFMAKGTDGDVVVITEDGSSKVFPAGHEAAVLLREKLPFTAPSRIMGKRTTIGLGDRLSLAGPGQLRAIKKTSALPILAQQSVRELTLTGRTFTDVIDAATLAVFREGLDRPWGADGDHLKNAENIKTAIDAGCTLITLDLSEQLGSGSEPRQIYGRAVEWVAEVWDTILKDANVDVEISVDETDEVTTAEQLCWIASELSRHEVSFQTIAPRFPGSFQKGVDYRGDLGEFEDALVISQAIAREHGFRISVHSGSDKFSAFPIVGRVTKGRFHLKTAGTSWVEAMKLVAQKDPALYRQAHALAVASFGDASKYYHVGARLSSVPQLDTLTDDQLPALFDMDDARQLIHITYGFILGSSELKSRLFSFWRDNDEAYAAAVEKHIGKHLELLGL